MDGFVDSLMDNFVPRLTFRLRTSLPTTIIFRFQQQVFFILIFGGNCLDRGIHYTGHIHLPNGCAGDLRQACRDYAQKFKESGGIDLQVLGIGANGHIGFNEPTGSLASRTWVKILSEQTMRDNAVYFDRPEDVPRHVVTMGIATVMETRH